PLTPEQTEILRWWIDADAPVDTRIAALDVPADIDAYLRVELGLAGSAAPSVAAAGDSAAADPAVVDALFAAGFLARQVSQSDPHLIVSVHSVGTQLDATQLETLRSAADSIVSLDLQSAGLDDADLAGFDAFDSLTSLRLSNNDLTDAGLAAVTQLQNLEVLNLYGNASISDAAIEALAQLDRLRAVYLWNTAVSPGGIARLRTQRPELEIIAGVAAAQ
ncbi:MAG: leucine-rich repeat domain-containing protein, partial [Gammaproteobacteria bacterium]